ncbi:hypothetical protein IEQ34_012829 [Dendrobium chrysotoxum]|uniref:Hcy-binding domain-containing protein n=1 Tax=Dendrobium chrysotoxum TaxID=161865 RepID=A0AAV7G6Q9_DENCH|nr:hypothetical protein IEQ34_012829 [Dendrobium chrysotoxum]
MGFGLRDPSAAMRDFLQQAGGCAVVDGGLATELEANGADLNDPLWSAKCLFSSPDLIRKYIKEMRLSTGNILSITNARVNSTVCPLSHLIPNLKLRQNNLPFLLGVLNLIFTPSLVQPLLQLNIQTNISLPIKLPKPFNFDRKPPSFTSASDFSSLFESIFQGHTNHNNRQKKGRKNKTKWLTKSQLLGENPKSSSFMKFL